MVFIMCDVRMTKSFSSPGCGGCDVLLHVVILQLQFREVKEQFRRKVELDSDFSLSLFWFSWPLMSLVIQDTCLAQQPTVLTGTTLSIQKLVSSVMQSTTSFVLSLCSPCSTSQYVVPKQSLRDYSASGDHFLNEHVAVSSSLLICSEAEVE